MQLLEQQQETYPLLPQLDYARRWLDGFISILESYLVSLSSPLLTIGIGFSMMDFLTQGQLLQSPFIGGAWAFVQTAAVDCQFISMWYKAKVAWKERQYGAFGGYVFLGLILAFVTFGANAVPSLQHATGINFLDALSRLGLNPISLIYARSGVSIMLAIIAAWTRTVVSFSRAENSAIKPKKKRQFFLIACWLFAWSLIVKLWQLRPRKKVANMPVKTENKSEDTPASEANPQNVLPEKKEPVLPADNPGENEPDLQEKNESMAASKSLSFEQVKTMTGLDEKQIKSLIKKGVLRTTPRNQNLIKTESVVAWQKEQHS